MCDGSPLVTHCHACNEGITVQYIKYRNRGGLVSCEQRYECLKVICIKTLHLMHCLIWKGICDCEG